MAIAWDVDIPSKERLPKMEATAITQQCAVTDWFRLIQAEYHEIPGLNLTKPQVQRLWGLDQSTTDALLDALVAAHVLRRTPREGYVLDHAAE